MRLERLLQSRHVRMVENGCIVCTMRLFQLRIEVVPVLSLTPYDP